MKIIATIRTFNEEQNIEKCCRSYAEFCDLVLVADGGSTDRTVEIASQMPKTEVLEFHNTVLCKDGTTRRNPDGPHLQFLWDNAIERGADWIISQDCDQRPNKFLKLDARRIMENTSKDFLLVTQIYLWGQSFYFPELSGGEGDWWQGLWAWRANINLKVIDKMPHFEFSFDGVNSIDLNKMENRCERTKPPYCFMHYGWQSEEKVDAQLIYYNTSGLIPGVQHPLKYGGRLDMLKDWMYE